MSGADPEVGLLAGLTAHISSRLDRTITEDEVFDAVAQRLIHDARRCGNVHLADQMQARLSEDRHTNPDRPLWGLLGYGVDKPPVWWLRLGVDLVATLCGVPPEQAAGNQGGASEADQ